MARLPQASFTGICSLDQLIQFGLAAARNQGGNFEPQAGLVYLCVGDRMSLITSAGEPWADVYPDPVHSVPAHDGGNWWGYKPDGTLGFSWLAAVTDIDGTSCVTCLQALPKDGQFELRLLEGPYQGLQPDYRRWLQGWAGVTVWQPMTS